VSAEEPIDLVARLRSKANCERGLYAAAADEIERLRAELEEANDRAVLRLARAESAEAELAELADLRARLQAADGEGEP
jgi:hypothetical protein